MYCGRLKRKLQERIINIIIITQPVTCSDNGKAGAMIMNCGIILITKSPDKDSWALYAFCVVLLWPISPIVPLTLCVILSVSNW